MNVSNTGVRLDGRVTPRLERVLVRAAELSTQRGDHYLGVEHVVLALLEDGASLPLQAWEGSLTVQQWRDAILRRLPEVASGDSARLAPVVVTSGRD